MLLLIWLKDVKNVLESDHSIYSLLYTISFKCLMFFQVEKKNQNNITLKFLWHHNASIQILFELSPTVSLKIALIVPNESLNRRITNQKPHLAVLKFLKIL